MAFPRGFLQDARSFLIMAQSQGLDIIGVLNAIDNRLSGNEDAKAIIKIKPEEQLCPNCGRFVMVPPIGVAEPVLVCPSCHYSEYRG
jgi:hypothetical protein